MNIDEMNRALVEKMIKSASKGRFNYSEIMKAHKKNKTKAWRRNSRNAR